MGVYLDQFEKPLRRNVLMQGSPPYRDSNYLFWAHRVLAENQSPKGIMRSAVPLPRFFDIVESQRGAVHRPQQGPEGSPGGPGDGGMGEMDRHSHYFLQDLVPCWGHCPKRQLCKIWLSFLLPLGL